MTHFLAGVLTTVKYLVADLLADESLASTLDSPLLFPAVAPHRDINQAFLALAWMALFLALMRSAVEQFAARALASVLAAGRDGARHALVELAAEAGHLHGHVAGWAAARVAEDLAGLVRTMLVLTLLAILSTRVWQSQWGVGRLVQPAAETEVLRHRVLSVAVVAVWAGPSEEGDDLLGRKHGFCLLHLLFKVRVLAIMGMTAVIPCACCLWGFLLFLIVLVVEPLDPALDAAKMEGLATLVAAPKGAPLENAVVTDDTLLGAF
jgi:hypothetical protein